MNWKKILATLVAFSVVASATIVTVSFLGYGANLIFHSDEVSINSNLKQNEVHFICPGNQETTAFCEFMRTNASTDTTQINYTITWLDNPKNCLVELTKADSTIIQPLDNTNRTYSLPTGIANQTGLGVRVTRTLLDTNSGECKFEITEG